MVTVSSDSEGADHAASATVCTQKKQSPAQQPRRAVSGCLAEPILTAPFGGRASPRSACGRRPRWALIGRFSVGSFCRVLKACGRSSLVSQSCRTGIRLDGPLIQRKADISESIISEGLISGSIQIPGDGKPIIILGETVSGGYRKIATVISADLPLLGQIRPGDEINFKSTSLDEASQALRKMESRIQRFKRSCS